MQNHYLEMMQETQALIARANKISSDAESVAHVLRRHKQDVADIQAMMAGRFDAIRSILRDDEENFNERFVTILGELDIAIAKIEGREPQAEPPPHQPPVDDIPEQDVRHAEG